MIRIENLSKIFLTSEVETSAINNINLHICEGEFVAIMGPSGCGKSTLLNILGLLDTLSSGEYYLNNQRVGHLTEQDRTILRRGYINFIFQNFNLIDQINVFKNVELPLSYLNIKGNESKQKVMHVLERVQMAHRKHHYPRQLSGGQQQRVAIARAVAANPKLLLADEPTGNLDSKNGLEVMKLLNQLNSDGTTIVMVTHSERDAEFAHRIIRLKDGEVVVEEKQKTLSTVSY